MLPTGAIVTSREKHRLPRPRDVLGRDYFPSRCLRGNRISILNATTRFRCHPSSSSTISNIMPWQQKTTIHALDASLNVKILMEILLLLWSFPWSIKLRLSILTSQASNVTQGAFEATCFETAHFQYAHYLIGIP